jgi:hypothetical protein
VKFEDPAALGAWAQAHNVTSVRFHADGSLARVDIMPTFTPPADAVSAEPETGAEAKPTAVKAALHILSGSGRDAWTDE